MVVHIFISYGTISKIDTVLLLCAGTVLVVFVQSVLSPSGVHPFATLGVWWCNSAIGSDFREAIIRNKASEKSDTWMPTCWPFYFNCTVHDSQRPSRKAFGDNIQPCQTQVRIWKKKKKVLFFGLTPHSGFLNTRINVRKCF